MKLNRRVALIVLSVAVLVGFIQDRLLGQALLGLGFFLFTVVWVSICVVATVAAKRPLSNHAFLYAAIALANALIVYFRDSLLVQFWSIIITLIALFLLVGTCGFENFSVMPLLNRWRETIKQFVLTALAAPVTFFNAIRQNNTRRSLNISRGAVIAAGLGLIFIMLFISADAVIGHMFSWLGDALYGITDFLGQFNIGRIISVSFWAFAAFSIILFIYQARSGDTKSSLTIRAQLTRKDSLIIISTLLTIFGAFIAIQAYYLFSDGKLPDGLTYAEYARQGYGQLLFATLLASASIKGVISATHERAKDSVLRLATAALVVLNGLVVISAWRRLSMYESAYGWTEARFVAHLGLICIALGCVALLVWLYGGLTSKQLYAGSWYFVLFVLMTAAIMNPDAIIVRKNIMQRSERVGMLDTNYLRGLSRDSWPTICAEAPRLAKSNPLEYADLARPRQDDQSAVSRGFSRHYTHEKAYSNRYSTCL